MENVNRLPNISSQYLNNNQIKLYLEACLNHKITDFKISSDSDNLHSIYYNKNEFERLKDKKRIKGQDNLFYRVWVYQYEGLKELLNQDENKILYTDNNTKNNMQENNMEENITPTNINDKKKISFKFTFGTIDINELKKENLFYKQITENPNLNFDEYKPTQKEIDEQKKDLKIIFLYVNLGVPLLEDDLEVEEIQEGSNLKKYEKFKYKYKYEFDMDKIVYYRKISFSLYEKDDIIKCNCKFNNTTPSFYWVYEEKDSGQKMYCCTNCYEKAKIKDNYKLIENTKYSIRYFSYCHEPGHNTKKYEYYCKECNKAYCIKCLSLEHKELNKIHDLVELNSVELSSYQSFCKEKLDKINKKNKKNNQIWEAINEAGDEAEISLRERESKAILDVKNEVLARCTYLTSLGYELQRMIGEIDNKTKFIQNLRKDSNVSTYLNMNNMFVEDLKNHYLPNLEKIEKIPLEKYLETFHKINKKLPEEVNKESYSEYEEEEIES